MDRKRPLRVLVFHGPDDAAKYELLAWLRGPNVDVDARTVEELNPSTRGTVDERVAETSDWAEKAIALITPDQRSPAGAPNVVDEIGRWRGSDRANYLMILRHKDCEDIWTNLAGVVRVEFSIRVNERFVEVLNFLGLLPTSPDRHTTLAPIPIHEVLDVWRDQTATERRGLFIVVGGAAKYDDERLGLGLKEYQSTAPVTGVVRLALALDQSRAPLVDAVCDYHDSLQLPAENGIDLVLVGGPDTNRVVRELFAQDTSNLPVWFDPPGGSDTLITRQRNESWSRGSTGLLLALNDPAPGYRNVVLCAGNGARGTNHALTVLARYLSGQTSNLIPLNKFSALVVEGGLADNPHVVWAGD